MLVGRLEGRELLGHFGQATKGIQPSELQAQALTTTGAGVTSLSSPGRGRQRMFCSIFLEQAS